jgi:hypothetical protein
MNSTMERRSLAAQRPILNESGMCTLVSVRYIHISISVRRHSRGATPGAQHGALDHRLVTECSSKLCTMHRSFNSRLYGRTTDVAYWRYYHPAHKQLRPRCTATAFWPPTTET